MHAAEQTWVNMNMITRCNNGQLVAQQSAPSPATRIRCIGIIVRLHASSRHQTMLNASTSWCVGRRLRSMITLNWLNWQLATSDALTCERSILAWKHQPCAIFATLSNIWMQSITLIRMICRRLLAFIHCLLIYYYYVIVKLMLIAMLLYIMLDRLRTKHIMCKILVVHVVQISHTHTTVIDKANII